MKFIVYMHIFPNSKVYIGITSCEDVSLRWRGGRGYSSQTLMHRAIQKYGWDNIEHIVLADNLSKEWACKIEQDLIWRYKLNNPEYGYNVYVGGDCGRLGIPLTPEEKQKLSERSKNIVFTDETKDKIRCSVLQYWTDDRRKEHGKLYGGTGFKLSEETAITIYDRLCNGESRLELADEYNVSESAIDRIAQRKYWSIRDTHNPIINRKLPIKIIGQYDINGNLIREWSTVSEIHKTLNFSTGPICECCNHKRSHAHKYTWKYTLILDTGERIIL